MYDYKHPNNGDNNDWHNIQVEDMARFWELPNYDEFKYFYFQQMNIGGVTSEDPLTGENHRFPEPESMQEVIKDEHKWLTPQWPYYYGQWTFGTVAAASGVFAYLFS